MKPKLTNILKWVWLVLVLVGAFFYFYRNHTTVLGLIQKLSVWRILLSLLFLLLGKLFLVFLVKFSIEAEGLYLSFWHCLGVYGMSSLGKYIPGGIWHFVGRIGIYRKNGLDTKQSTKAIVLENIWMLSSAAILGIVSLLIFRHDLFITWLDLELSPSIRILLLGFTILSWLGALSITKRFFDRYTKDATRSVWKPAICGLLLWFFVGMSFFIMFDGCNPSNLGIFIGGYAVSWAVGYAAIFAPGGVGIREAVLVLVFASLGSPDKIGVYAAMNRIIWMVAELIYGIVGFLQKPEPMLTIEDDILEEAEE